MTDRLDWLEPILRSTDLPVWRDGVDLWISVPSELRGALTVKVTPGERTVTFRTFTMRAPDRRREEVYRRLLRRNDQATVWAFSLDPLGDVFLVANLPRATIDADAVDGMLGALSALVDETFAGLVRTGFAVPDGVSVTGPPLPAPSDEG